jgi:branched-chain amino acid transport system ATP-binding protein
MLEATEISVRFGGVVALDQVSLRVAPGEVVGLVGPNGSGKSTFLNAVTGMVGASGSLRIDGTAQALGAPRRIRRAGVLRTFQTPQVYGELSCLDNAVLSSPDDAGIGLVGSWLRRGAMLHHERERWAAGNAALARVGLGGLEETDTAELSYGQQRMVEIARVIVGQPRMILLDEPAAGLNSAETEQLADLLVQLNGEGVSLLIVDHKVDFLDRLCQRLVVLQLGKVIASGTPAEVWADPAVVDAYLGTAR